MLVTLDVMGVADDCMSSEVLDGFAYGKDGWSFSQAMALLFSGWIPAALKPLTKCSGWRLSSHNCLRWIRTQKRKLQNQEVELPDTPQ